MLYEKISIILGILGSFLLIITFLLLQLNKIKSDSMIYSLLNLIGSGLIIISLFFDWNLPSFIIEFFWSLISLLGIIKIQIKKIKGE